MTEFSALPSLLSQFQLPPAPEAPTTIWVALKDPGVNWMAVSAIATLILACVAVWQILQTNKIIQVTNKQIKELQRQNNILNAQLDIERARQYPTLIASKRTPGDRSISLVNVSRNPLFVFGADYVTEEELREQNFVSEFFHRVREWGLKVEAVAGSQKDEHANIFNVPTGKRLAVSAEPPKLPCESHVYLAVAVAYSDMGPAVLTLPLTCDQNNKVIMLNGATEFKLYEVLLEQLSGHKILAEDQL